MSKFKVEMGVMREEFEDYEWFGEADDEDNAVELAIEQANAEGWEVNGADVTEVK